jgi:membrane-associated phospholipid phosphatase
LNTALAITNDAIIGYWDGSADIPKPGKPAGYGALGYVSPQRRIDLLQAELGSLFAVNTSARKRRGKAALLFNGHEIFKTRAPKAKVFREQLIWLRNYADLRFDRIPETNTQIFDKLSFFGLTSRLDAGARLHTLELLAVVQSLTYHIEMLIKHACWSARPVDYSASVQPIIQTPDHSSYPSGHAAESFAIATVLSYLMDPSRTTQEAVEGQHMPFRIAHRVAVNRTVAGVHFPVDSAAGAVLGCQIGGAILSLLFGAPLTKSEFRVAKGAATPTSGAFFANSDFLLSEFPTAGWSTTGHSAPDAGTVASVFADAIRSEWV